MLCVRLQEKYICLMCGHALDPSEPPLPNGSTELVQSLRRRLMNDNYDYMPLESEETFPRSGASSPASPPAPQHHSADLASDINDIYLPRALPSPQLSAEQTSSDSGKLMNIPGDDTTAPYPASTPLPAHVIDDSAPETASRPELDRQDPLYYEYMDDHELTRRRALAAPTAIPSPASTNTGTEHLDLEEEGEAEVDIIDTTPYIQYKIIKVKTPEKSRRSGKAERAFRRYLQEEGPDGVAIVKRGDEPFPDFRLASQLRSSGELFPPPLDSSELEAASETPSDLDEETFTRPPIND